jgi:hypothetical protein
MTTLTIPVILALTLSTQDDTAAQVMKLWSRVIEERLKITSGIFHIESKGLTTINGERTEYDNRMRLVLDGDSLLMDLTRVGKETFRELHSWGPVIVASYTDRKAEGAVSLMATVSDIGSSNEADQKRWMIDPRKIGMYPTGFMILAQFELGGFMNTKHIRRFLAIESQVYDGRDCKVIVREAVSGAIGKVWIDPERDYSIVRFEIENKAQAEPESSIYEIQLTYHPEAKRWFPSACSNRWLRSSAPIEEERVAIRAEKLNQPIDQELFELSGMNIPPGTGLSVTGKLRENHSGLAQWNGRAIEPIEPKPYRHPSSTNQTIWLALATLLAFGAAIIVWRVLSNAQRIRS